MDLALFKSIKSRWVRLTVRTHASHACNTSSILVPTTKEKEEMQFNYISSFSL